MSEEIQVLRIESVAPDMEKIRVIQTNGEVYEYTKDAPLDVARCECGCIYIHRGKDLCSDCIDDHITDDSKMVGDLESVKEYLFVDMIDGIYQAQEDENTSFDISVDMGRKIIKAFRYQAAEIKRLSRQNTDLQANNTKLVLENRRLREVINRVPVMISASIASNYNRNPYVCGQDAQRIKDMCNEVLKGGCDET